MKIWIEFTCIELSNRLLTHFIGVGNNDKNSSRELTLAHTHLIQPAHSNIDNVLQHQYIVMVDICPPQSASSRSVHFVIRNI